MTTATNTREVLDLERQFWNAMKEKDATVASQMTDDGCIVVGAQGVSAIDSETMGKLSREGPWKLERYTFDEKNTQVRFLSDDVALVAYKVKEHVVVDGAPVDLEAHDSSVWVKRDGAWLCAMHTESLAGDPYGRDRTK